MRTFLLATAIAALAAPAFAGSDWTAAPARPSSETGFVGSSVVWDCHGSTCVAASDTSQASPSAECRAVAHEVGPLTSFTGPNGPLGADALSVCNKDAKH